MNQSEAVEIHRENILQIIYYLKLQILTNYICKKKNLDIKIQFYRCFKIIILFVHEKNSKLPMYHARFNLICWVIGRHSV